LYELPIIIVHCTCIENGSSDNLRCYPPDSHQSHNAVYWRTRGSHLVER